MSEKVSNEKRGKLGGSVVCWETELKGYRIDLLDDGERADVSGTQLFTG